MNLTADPVTMAQQDALIESLGFLTASLGTDLWHCVACRWVGYCRVRTNEPDLDGLEAFRDHADRTCPRRATARIAHTNRPRRWPWLI